MAISRSSGKVKDTPPYIPSHKIKKPKPPAFALDYEVKPTGGGTMKSMGAATKGGKFQGTF